jgi:tetratricopeptide (TPR) repeat protein
MATDITHTPTARTEPVSICSVCGNGEVLCSCAERRKWFHEQARIHHRLAVLAARRNEVDKARKLLLTACSWSQEESAALRLLGLCSLALGHVVEARRVWQRAHRLAPSEQLEAWIESLEHGELRQVMEGYNRAVALARSQRYDQAGAELDSTLRTVPDFLPAVRLRGLILLAQGDDASARALCRARLEAGWDDPELLRLAALCRESTMTLPTPLRSSGRRSSLRAIGAAVALSAVAFLAGLGLRIGVESDPGGLVQQDGRDATPELTAPATQDQPDVSSSVAAMLGALLAGREDDLLRVLDERPEVRGALAEPALARLRDLEQRIGWNRYRIGRDAVTRGDMRLGIEDLGYAVRYGEGTFYHDDALYLLARAHVRNGETSEAMQAAERLLHEHPRSIYNNSITRHIARTGREP